MVKLQNPENVGTYQANKKNVLFETSDLIPINPAEPYGEPIGSLIEGKISYLLLCYKKGHGTSLSSQGAICLSH